MKIAIRYFTRSGNTKRLADAVANALNETAEDVSVNLSKKVDILFLGSSLYAGSFDPAVKEFIEKNADKIGTIVSFGSSASGNSTFKKIKILADEKGISLFDEKFNCPGHFLFLHKNRPNEKDIEAVSAFAKSVCEKLSK